MGLSKNYCRASSLLESVIALTIISVCLYIAVLVFSAVFTRRTSVRYYATQNQVDACFFLAQTAPDTLSGVNGLEYETEDLSDGLQKVTIHYRDSLNIDFENSFYIPGP